MNKLNKGLLFNRLGFWDDVRKSKIAKTHLGKARLFLDTKYLVETEEKLSKSRGYSPIPFHNLLSELSPFYRKVFEIRADLRIPIVPVIKSSRRALEVFDPWVESQVEFPAIKDELHWLVKQDLNHKNLRELHHLLEFNFSTFHDVLHGVFSVLVKAPKGKISRDYFLFVEALVLAQERYFAADLGLPIGKALKATDSILRAFSLEEAHCGGIDGESEFLGLLLTHLGFMNRCTRREMQMRLPTFAPYISHPCAYINPRFVKEITPRWLREHQSKIAKTAPKIVVPRGYRTLELKDFSLSLLSKDRASLHQTWLWWGKVFK